MKIEFSVRKTVLGAILLITTVVLTGCVYVFSKSETKSSLS